MTALSKGCTIMLVLYDVGVVENSVEVCRKASDAVSPATSVLPMIGEYRNRLVCPGRQAVFIVVAGEPRPLKTVNSRTGAWTY